MSLALSTIYAVVRECAYPAPLSRTELYCRAYEQLRDRTRRSLTADERDRLHHAAREEFARLTSPEPPRVA